MKKTVESNKILKAIELVFSDMTTYLFKKYNLLNIILPNLLHQILRRIIFSKFYKKKKIILKNSYNSEKFFGNFFKGKLDFQYICNDFFAKTFFSYPILSEKKKIISLLKELNDNEIRSYIDYADEIIDNKFKIFEKNHHFRNDIDWHFSFFGDYSFDINASEKLNYFGFSNNNELIDVKYVWEFNRHQFLHYLGIAYYITNNEKYSYKYRDLILDWIKKNPPLFGVNWASGLDISIRLNTWIFSLWFFKDSKLVNNRMFFEKIFKSMFQHAYYLRFFYTRYSFNHTVGDLFGVYLFSKVFNNLNPLIKWEKKFFEKFRKQIFFQTRSDGVNIEQSINYHRFVLEFFTLFVILDKKKMYQKELNRIEKMFDFLIYTIKPDMNFPVIGDSDDGSILPLNFYRKNKFNDLINLSSILFTRSDLKYISKDISVISLLFLGYEGYNKFINLLIKKPKYKYHFFKKSGYITFRDSWSKKANYLFLDYGKFGPLHASHSHSGITNLVLSINGKDLLIDSGTFTYNKSWEIRNLFRSSKSHNVLSINSKNQADIVNWWMWKNKPKLKRIVTKKENNYYFSCYHNGYKNFIIYRKVIVPVDFKELKIIDEIIKEDLKANEIESSRNVFDIFFHFDNKNKIELRENRILINSNLIMKFKANRDFSLSLIDTYYSLNYGVKIPNKSLRIRINEEKWNDERIKIYTKLEYLNNSFD